MISSGPLSSLTFNVTVIESPTFAVMLVVSFGSIIVGLLDVTETKTSPSRNGAEQFMQLPPVFALPPIPNGDSDVTVHVISSFARSNVQLSSVCHTPPV